MSFRGKNKYKVGDIFYSPDYKMRVLITFKKYGLYWGLWEQGQAFNSWVDDDFANMEYKGTINFNVDNLFNEAYIIDNLN